MFTGIPRLKDSTPLKRELRQKYYRDRSYSAGGSIFNTVYNVTPQSRGSFESGFGRALGQGAVGIVCGLVNSVMQRFF